MNHKCAIFHCQAPIAWVRIIPNVAPDNFCQGHAAVHKDFGMKDLPNGAAWHSYKDYQEEQEKIKHMEECVESGQKFERSRQIEMRDILYSEMMLKGWIEIDMVPPPSNEIVILRDDLGSYAGFRVENKEYKKLNTAGISIKPPIPVYWMPLPKRK